MELLGVNGFNPYGSDRYVFTEHTTDGFRVTKEHLLSLGVKEQIEGLPSLGMPCFRPVDTILLTGYDAVELLYQNTRNEFQSLLGVRKGKACGLINMLGVQVFPLEYSSIICPINSIKPVFCVKRLFDHKWAAINIFGEVIVPYGTYYYMWGFDHNHCLVSTSSGTFKNRAIIGIDGEILISPDKYIDIYNFRGKTAFKVEDNNHNISILSVESLNKVSNTNGTHEGSKCGDDYPYDEPGQGSYEQYGGYNGYDDFTIDSAFDGDPEASWNID